MANTHDFHLSFESKNQSFDLAFREQTAPSKDTVLIDGRYYGVVGDDYKILWLRGKLPELVGAGITLTGLKDRLIQLGAKDVSTSTKVNIVGVEVLSLTSSSRMRSERKALPVFQHLVAETYWNQYATSVDKDHSMLKKVISESSTSKEQTFLDFEKAFSSQNKSLFCSLFSHLEFYQLYRIVGGERLNIQMPNVKDGSVDVSDPKFSAEIKDYLKERGFTGVVALSDGRNDLVVRTDNIENDSTPMSIHSVGKVATGLLVLRLLEGGIIKEEDLKKPIQLDEQVVRVLPEKVQQRLRETTFLDVMTHKSGIGDYLKGYQDAVQDAIKLGKPIPEMASAASFVKYADEDLQTVGEGHYSNLGILLVGLSAQHHLSQVRGGFVSYDEALREFVLDPAKVGLFSSLKPEGAVFNSDDEVASHIRGSPAGGQWSTAADLLKLGKKVGEWSKEKRFGELLSDFGGEFWNNGELWHAGSIASASAHLTHFPKQNLTVAVLSITPGFCQATAVAETIQDRLITEPLAMSNN